MAGNVAELIKKACEGDKEAFEKLIIAHEKIVYNIALRMLKNTCDAEDASQEVFIKVYKSLKRFDGKSAFSTWIYRITVNTCIDIIRKHSNQNTVSIDEEIETNEHSVKKQFQDSSPTPEETALSSEKASEVHKALQKLSSEHRTIITLRDIEGFSYSEISDITQMPVGTVKSRISRARSQLQTILEKSELFSTSIRLNSKKGGDGNEM